MTVADRLVAALLRSPLHAALSGSTAVIRYRGRRSGRTIETPVQWAPICDGVVIFVARAGEKQWWRNFVDGGDLEVLVRGRWRPLHATAVRGATDPDEAERLVARYLARFPKAARVVPTGPDGHRDVREVVVVRCDPRVVAADSADATGAVSRPSPPSGAR